MNKFSKQIWASAIGSITGFFMLFLGILLLILFSTLSGAIFNNKEKINPNSIVKIQFDYPIFDKLNTNPFINLNSLANLELNNSTNLYSILKSIEEIGENKNIDGVFLDLRNFQSPGLASLKEIRDAFKKVKEKNKFIYAYSNIFSKSSYYLASVADSIFMYPTGGVEFSGLSTTIPFFTETMREIGVQPEIIRHGKFKAAVEPFMLTEMSEENRKQTEILLNDVWGVMLQEISQDRNISLEDLNKIADDLTISLLPNKAVEKQLIDQLIYPDSLYQILKAKTNKEELEFLSIHQLKHKKSKSKNQIAVIYAEGDIDGNVDNIHSGYATTIKEILEDDAIDAVVFRINSPGGSALISDEILSQMKLSKKDKPIVVSMGNYAASGGYYISCAADKIIASPNTITGSIGVFGLFFTAEELLTKKMKLHFDNVKTNKFANLGEVHRSLSNEEKALIQISVKNTYNEFINHVSQARNISVEEVDLIGQGRVWTGLRAEQIGLVDSIGGLQDAIEIAGKLANVEAFTVVEFPQIKDGIEAIFSDFTHAKTFNKKTFEEIQIEIFKQKFLNKQGIQALLPIKYELN